jgi:mRNA-degrading endonuclease YafQ of YafQ-DinJ toxin-antitoxin module
VFALRATDSFLRRARKFLLLHPQLEPRFQEVVEDLRKDPFDPHLGLHPLKGKLEGVFAARLDRRYRITLTLVMEPREITLLDIGSHDEVYR